MSDTPEVATRIEKLRVALQGRRTKLLDEGIADWEVVDGCRIVRTSRYNLQANTVAFVVRSGDARWIARHSPSQALHLNGFHTRVLACLKEALAGKPSPEVAAWLEDAVDCFQTLMEEE